jgi:hypothetical protein
MPAIRAGAVEIDAFKEIKLEQKPMLNGYLTKEGIEALTQVTLASKDLDRISDICCFYVIPGLQRCETIV